MKKIIVILLLLLSMYCFGEKGEKFRLGFDVGLNIGIDPSLKYSHDSAWEFYKYETIRFNPNTSIIFNYFNHHIIRFNCGAMIMYNNYHVTAYPIIGISYGYLFNLI